MTPLRLAGIPLLSTWTPSTPKNWATGCLEGGRNYLATWRAWDIFLISPPLSFMGKLRPEREMVDQGYLKYQQT
jgi:hypothetical protein